MLITLGSERVKREIFAKDGRRSGSNGQEIGRDSRGNRQLRFDFGIEYSETCSGLSPRTRECHWSAQFYRVAGEQQISVHLSFSSSPRTIERVVIRSTI